MSLKERRVFEIKTDSRFESKPIRIILETEDMYGRWWLYNVVAYWFEHCAARLNQLVNSNFKAEMIEAYIKDTERDLAEYKPFCKDERKQREEELPF